MRLTHIGGPTVLIEAHGWRILTDPTFDPAGQRYSFGWGTSSRKTLGPAIPAEQVGKLDAVLLSHDHHADNLDTAGRALLPGAGTVVTTPSGHRRLRTANARGLAPWSTAALTAPGLPGVEVTATPCRHGPKFSRPIAGEVIGFALRWPDMDAKVLWISGDTVLYDGVREIATRLDVDTAVLHLGGVQFPITGPITYSMTGRDALDLLEVLDPRFAVPVHYDGWSHFHEPSQGLREVLGAAAPQTRDRIAWLTPGVAKLFD